MFKPWTKTPNRTRDRGYHLLSLEARGLLAGLEMEMARGPLEGNLSHLATWLGVNRKECRLKTHLDRLIAAGYIVGTVEDRGKEGLWYTLDLPENHPERESEKPKKGARKPREEGKNDSGKPAESPEKAQRKPREKGEDKSSNNAGFGDSSLNKIYPSDIESLPSEGEGDNSPSIPPAGGGDSVDASPSAKGYSAEFEEAWQAYPQRGGGNSKKQAFKAWSARLREGVTERTLIDGVHRYRRFCEATGKIGTETVKMAATFFGPDEHWLEVWGMPASAQRPGSADPPMIPGRAGITTNGGRSVFDLLGVKQPPTEPDQGRFKEAAG